MTSPLILLPGDDIPPENFPASSGSAPLRLGPGLRLLSSQPTPTTTSKSHTTTHVLSTTQPGILSTDHKRNGLSMQTPPNRRYIPTANDLVIAQVHHSSPDYFHCVVTPQAPQLLLGQLSFEGASKKTRPMLKGGDLVYARVLSMGMGPGAEAELTCVNPATGKAEPGGLGPLTGGMVFDVSVGMAARLMRASSSSSAAAEDEDGAVAGLAVLGELGKKLEKVGGFEIAVGRNGKVWVDCANGGDSAVKATVAIGRCLTAIDELGLAPADQRKLVSRVLREMKVES